MYLPELLERNRQDNCIKPCLFVNRKYRSIGEMEKLKINNIYCTVILFKHCEASLQNRQNITHNEMVVIVVSNLISLNKL